MRYFFLVYALIALLVVGIFGFPGQKFSKSPVRIFPDMDEQDKLKAQKPEPFFADGHGGRLPVARTQPRGFNADGTRVIGGIPEYEFGGGTGYYVTGQIGDYFGSGMPEELELTPATAGGLIRRGQERFGIYCAVCHGAAGDGQGITSAYGVPVNTNPNAKLSSGTPESYPDGRMFNTITNGMGRMSGYGYHISVRDRWAVIAYVRTLQAAKQAANQAR
jgi:mono/diheme cytochrome c family protein